MIQSVIDYLEKSSGPIDPRILADVLRESNISVEHIAEWIAFNDELYARHSIAKFPFAELLVMCWKPGQLTPIHDHKGSACAIKVLEGISTEILYEHATSGVLIPQATERHSADEVSYSYDLDIHKMGNVEKDEDLITLHCYSPPLSNINVFNESSAFFAGYEKTCTLAAQRLKVATAVN